MGSPEKLDAQKQDYSAEQSLLFNHSKTIDVIIGDIIHEQKYFYFWNSHKHSNTESHNDAHTHTESKVSDTKCDYSEVLKSFNTFTRQKILC